MNPRRNVAILTLSLGAGQMRAAEVIQRALQEGGESMDVRTLDAFDLGRSWFRRLYAAPAWWMLRSALLRWRTAFKWRRSRPEFATAPAWVFRRGCREVFRRISVCPPHLVIATDVGAVEIAALGKREGWFNCPILAVQTDIQVAPPCVQREVDVYAVASEEARAQLIALGVSLNRVVLAGFPIEPAFSLPFDKTEVLQALGLDPRRPMVLVMGGGVGPIPLDDVIAGLERCGLPLQVVAVCGQDRAQKARVESHRHRIALDLHVFGWTEMVPELMAAADLLVTRPGGVTTAEALTAGLPMVLTPAVPGPEGTHARFLEQYGAAVLAQRSADIPRIVQELLGDADRLAGMARLARELGRPEAAHAVAQVAGALLETSSYIDFLTAPPTRSGESAYLM